MDATLEGILRAAVDAGASDVHLKPGAPVVFRVARDLVAVEAPVPNEDWIRSVLADIVPAHLRDRLARRLEADFAFAVAGLGRFRINVFLQRGQMAVALRLVKTALNAFRELNLPDAVRGIAEAPRGIVIIAGAIGSGKSTTLAAMIEHVNVTRRRHIITLEDPIEYLFDDKQSVIEQREIGLDTESYGSGLRHVLRQDPDVIVIGEMRDAESADAAMSAANIGHLVLTTLHTSDAMKSVQRVVEFFPAEERDYARQLFASTLHAVLCQRLVSSATGGVLPAVEILINNSAAAQAISASRVEKLPGIMELGIGEGMQTFDHALVQLVKAGRISREEAIAHAGNPDQLRMIFQGVVLSETHRILGARGER
ncbi:MAG: PilT/PilU family type 4a pilus ATPase [Verrucomicrobiota bacterium]|nr:PilT/PilU family type 4a pilus ATPase [Verrucomicrobiota bacterium]